MRWFTSRSRRSPPAGRSAEAAWAAEELQPWAGRGLDRTAVAAEAERLSDLHHTAVVLSIRGGEVGVRLGLELPPEHRPLLERVELYRRLLQDVVRLYRLDLEVDLLLDVNDVPLFERSIPSFGFQKPRGHASVLLPDVDLLSSGFYADVGYKDGRDFADKRDHAVFVGSTTGGWMDAEAVRERRLPRLRSAERFREEPDVTFELPNLVQCVTPEAEEMLRALDLGSRHYSWAEQFENRIIVSMDGNGATCSRVAVALGSRSLLAKYRSDSVLHYFGGLVEGAHYAALEDDDALVALVAAVRRDPARFEAMAQQGRRFASRHLGRLATLEYVAELLLRYARLLEGEDLAPAGEALSPAGVLVDLRVESPAFGRRLGEVGGWAGAPRSRAPLSVVTLFTSPRLAEDAVTIRVAGEDGEAGPEIEAGEDAAPVGGGLIHAFVANLGTAGRRKPRLRYQCLFVDGALVACTDGRTARSPSGAPLEALRVELR